MDTNKVIVNKINEHTEALNILSKRIDKKAGSRELSELFAEMLVKIEEYKNFISDFTNSHVNMFTESLRKNEIANDKLVEAVDISLKQGKELQDWFNSFMIDFIIKFMQSNEDDDEWL